MFNLYLNPTTYDLEVTSAFNLKLTANIGEYLSQKIENVLKTFFGEWYLNRSIGIPYFQRILKKQVDIDDVNNIFLIAVSNIEEVEEVLEFETTFDNSSRNYSISFVVRTSETDESIEGQVEVSV